MKCVTFTFEGKRYWVRAKTKAEARQKASAKKALLKAGVKDVRGGLTVYQWSEQWMETYKSNVSTAWYKSMNGIIKTSIIPVIGQMPVKDVRPIDITKVMNGVTGMSESYVKKTLLILRQMFDRAEENSLILKDPTKRVKAVYEEQEEKRPLTKEEREKTIRAARAHPDMGLFFLVMLWCGCRPQEVAVLRRHDFDGNTLHITKALKADGTVGKPKSRAGIRDIPVPSVLTEMLPDIPPDQLVCTNTLGEQLTKTSIRGLWRRFSKDAGLDGITPYIYRHTYCTDLQDAGVPLVVASRLMGHSDVKVTAKIYTHASTSSFEDALSRIEGATSTATL